MILTSRTASTTHRRAAAVMMAAAALAASLGAAPALAQGDYPGRPITLVIPFPPGGSADTIGRYSAR